MSYRQICPAQKNHAERTVLFQCAAVVALLSWMLLLSGCSGSSLPKANSSAIPSSGTSSSSGASTSSTSSSTSTPAPSSSNTTSTTSSSSSTPPPPSPAPPS